jgi:predicted dehydrogenase
MAKPVNVGLIGYGFMGRTHSNAYRQVNKFFKLDCQPVLKACCARNEAKIKEFAENWGWESYETDWKKLIERKDIDLIDIGSPNNTHFEIAMAAAKAGKMILCEKPLAMTVKEAEEMTAAIEKAGVPNMVWFNYRRVPAISLAKQVVDEGGSDARSITGRLTCRTGRSPKMFRRVARRCGVSTRPSPEAA